MIQRIQSVYLALAFMTSGVLPFVFKLWTETTTDTIVDVYFVHSMLYVVLFGMASTLSIMSLVNFKKRQQQFVMNRVAIILNFILLGLFVYRVLNLSGEAAKVSEKGIGMFLPIISIVFLVLANKAIKRDEDLVKSVDRLR